MNRVPLLVPVAQSPAGAVGDRLIALLVVALAIASVVTLSFTSPDARGHGTHEQLGMIPCSWPILYGRPCPTCGVTTAAAHVVHLAPIEALRTQPFGALLAIVGLWFAAIALRALWLGESLVARVSVWPWAKILIGVVVALLAGWAWTWLHWPASPIPAR
ncbi:MAG: DUF2752 domain-containing protein [Planctomycetota bacterium]